KYYVMKNIDTSSINILNCYDHELDTSLLNLSDLIKQQQEKSIKVIKERKNTLAKLGIFTNWINTCQPQYVSDVLKTFIYLYESGYLYKGYKTSIWCVNCQTELYETEIEYRKYNTLSLYVKFPLITGFEELGDDVYILVWTDTPYVLSDRKEISVNPNFVYSAVQTKKGTVIMAEDLVEKVMQENNIVSFQIIKKIQGQQLKDVTYSHPLINKESKLILDENVSLQHGTGCAFVNIKSYSNHENLEYNLKFIADTNQNGQILDDKFYGHKIFDISSLISLQLDKRGYLFSARPTEQSYPHCIYCKEPIITTKASKHWIIDINNNGLKQRVLKILDEINWVPSPIKNRIANSLSKMNDIVISRQRRWGIPILAFYCGKCKSQIDISETLKAFGLLIDQNKFLNLEQKNIETVLPDDIVCNNCGERDLKWEGDIIDKEFISALSYKSIQYCDQNSLMIANIKDEKLIMLYLITAITDDSPLPFGASLIIEPIKTSNNSKSNISINELMNKYETDIIRLWSISMNFRKRLLMTDAYINQIEKIYRRIKNVCKFLIANLNDFDPDNDKVEIKYLKEIDRLILHKLSKLTDEVTESMENCQFSHIYHNIYYFLSKEISSLYISVVKRRLYTSPKWSSGRRSVQTVIYEVITTILKLIAPILPFTAEEMWENIPSVKSNFSSIFMSDWPESRKGYLDYELENAYKYLLRIRKHIYKSSQNNKEISNIAQAVIAIYAYVPEVHEFLNTHIDALEEILMVSKVRLMPPNTPIPDEIIKVSELEGLAFEIRNSNNAKCERCWVYSDTVGSNDQYPTLCHKCIAAIEGIAYYI
ncbi:MAG: class I tRNA ligase family protein, partial [bacterium]